MQYRLHGRRGAPNISKSKEGWALMVWPNSHACETKKMISAHSRNSSEIRLQVGFHSVHIGYTDPGESPDRMAYSTDRSRRQTSANTAVEVRRLPRGRGARGFDERFKEVVSRFWWGHPSALQPVPTWREFLLHPLSMNDAIGGVPRTQGRSLGHVPKLFGGHPISKPP